MCQCKEGIGWDTPEHYSQNQTILDVPDYITLKMNEPDRAIRKTVAIDNCLIDEIKLLWSVGVVTAGCCCGHNNPKLHGSQILVEEESISLMQQLGYKHWSNPCDTTRQDGFTPMGSSDLINRINDSYFGI